MTTHSSPFRRKWANGTDQLLAGRRFVAIFGGLRIPTASQLNDALAQIADSGPHTRLTVVPLPGRRLWRVDGPSSAVIDLPNSAVREGITGILQHVRRRPGGRRPLEVHTSDRYLVLDIDHGLGDGRFALELAAALFAITDGRTLSWVEDSDMPFALPRSLVHTFGRHPSRVRKVFGYAAGIRSSRRTCTTNSVSPIAWSPSSAVTMAHVSAEAEHAVDQWRRANAEGIGSSAVWLFLVRQALRAAGLPMIDSIAFAFDCRRYMPAGGTANMNFVIGLDMSLAADEPLTVFGSRVKSMIESGVPLAGMAAISARGLLRARRQAMPQDRVVGVAAEVMYTDMGRIAMLDDLPWDDSGDRMASGLVDPGGPNGVTILNTRMGQTRKISFSFHDNVFDRDVLETAAAYLEQPIQFLVASELPRGSV